MKATDILWVADCEEEFLHMLDDFYVDCCHWLYAVKRFKA